MYYIYCYENKINGKCYVGQTSNIERRNKEHMSRAFNYLANETGTLFHQMLRKYGKENFQLSILEVIEDATQDYIDEREIYWIKEKHSFVQDNGYNMTRGGRRNTQIKEYKTVSDKEIVDLLQNSDLSFQQIADKFNMGLSTIKKINNGKLRSYLSNDYPIRKKSVYQQRADKVKDLLLNTTLTFTEIGAEVHVDADTVSRINKGLTHKDENLNYPLR